jgi:hypothetical protein
VTILGAGLDWEAQLRGFKGCRTAAGAVLLAALVVSGCSSTPAPTLIPGLSDSPPDPAKGISGGSFSLRADIFSIEMGTFLCSVRAVRLTSVRLYRPRGGIQLARWGVENNHITMKGVTSGPLAKLGPFTSHEITRGLVNLCWPHFDGLIWLHL